jgi:hypothetical protein
VFDEREPKEVMYRDYKNFNNINFRRELKATIHGTGDWVDFERGALGVIDKHAPIKKKTIRANQTICYQGTEESYYEEKSISQETI